MPGSGSITSDSTSSSLLQRVRERDPAAWERLSELYGPVVYRWARAAGLQASDAADTVQEVFSAVARHIADFRRQQAGDSFRGWLWTITRNKIRDNFRARAGRPDAAGGSEAQQRMMDVPEKPPQLAEDAKSESARLRLRILELIRAEFQEDHWRAFWRTVVDGVAPSDVADELGMSVWMVYKAKARILHRLRQESDGIIED